MSDNRPRDLPASCAPSVMMEEVSGNVVSDVEDDPMMTEEGEELGPDEMADGPEDCTIASGSGTATVTKAFYFEKDGLYYEVSISTYFKTDSFDLGSAENLVNNAEIELEGDFGLVLDGLE